MSFQQKIDSLKTIYTKLSTNNDWFDELAYKAQIENQWFTKENIELAVKSIKDNFLNEAKLNEWLQKYDFVSTSKTVGIIAAGNLPLVGFHDVFCCFVLNIPAKVKLSSKDTVLMTYFINLLKEADKNWNIEIVERLIDYDAVIATGSNNSNRYFEQYFAKVPSILRKNRNSVAVLNGKESKEDLENLAKDIFQYFGMGCRNVTQVLLPEGYDVTHLFPHFSAYDHYADHKLYKDNFDYNCTLLLMNQVPHLANYFVILKEDTSLHPRLATLHYSFYKTEEAVTKYLQENAEEIQCIVGNSNKYLPFGKAQQPELWDYADNVDTIGFLLELN
jgi:hypothetical protein